jgi:glyoxylase-like metal-dependent hydrolase (beta-lactamase superfamily II)
VIVETFPVGPFQCNCTLLGDEATGEAIVVDPGDQFDLIQSRLAHHKLTKVKSIVHTHAHLDHIGASALLRRATGAPVGLHEGDRFLWENASMQAMMLRLKEPEMCAIDHSMEDGDVLRFAGIEGEVLYTPGHTPGSLCFHFPVLDKLLISGDTLFQSSIGRTDLPGGDYNQILTSIHSRLLVLDDDTRVIPGHGPITTIGQEKRYNPFLQK